MQPTQSQDAASQETDQPAARLMVKEYDALAVRFGLRKVAQQAREHGIHRSTMFRIRAGGEPGLGVAMRIARDLGVPVEKIFELTAA